MLRFKVGDRVILARSSVSDGDLYIPKGEFGKEFQVREIRSVMNNQDGYQLNHWTVLDEMLDPVLLTPFEAMVNEYIRSELTQ